jgi:hypothetical protein
MLLLACFLNSNAQAIWTSRPDKPKKDKVTMDEFRNELLDWIFYRGIAIENQSHGKLTALFMVGKDRKTKYIHIVQSPDDALSYLVITALKKVSFPNSIQSDRPYIQPIIFSVVCQLQ